jgi:hypothetical protein
LQALRDAAISQLKSLENSAYQDHENIQSPNANAMNLNAFDQQLKGLLNVPPPKKDKN